MKRTSFKSQSGQWFIAVWLAILALSARGATAAPAGMNVPAIAVDALVTNILEANPELNFYKAEIAAAKGERRTAATWANPELATTVGDKRVTDGSLVGEGIAWSVSVRQTFEWP